jgi:hypothetical protein
MRNRLSSFPAENAVPWYREPWPWLLGAGPLVVVIAAIATAWVAIRNDDGVVAGDYYKRGLLVNQRLPKVAAIEPAPTVSVTWDSGGELKVRLERVKAQDDALRVTLVHPATGARESVMLARDSHGDYTGQVRASQGGAWIVSFDSRPSPLPTTIVERP